MTGTNGWRDPAALVRLAYATTRDAVVLVGWIALWLTVFVAAVLGVFIIPAVVVLVGAILYSLGRAVTGRLRRRGPARTDAP